MAARSRRFSEADAAFGIGRGKTFENMIGDSWRTMQVALKSSRPESLATRRYVRFQKRDRGEHRKQYCPRPRTELAGLLLYSLPNTRIDAGTQICDSRLFTAAHGTSHYDFTSSRHCYVPDCAAMSGIRALSRLISVVGVSVLIGLLRYGSRFLQRATAALRALSRRSSAERRFARAFPPFCPRAAA